MHIFINGEQRDTEQPLTLSVLVDQLQLEGERFAIEVNQELVPRSSFAEHQLAAGDQIEIVQAIGGG